MVERVNPPHSQPAARRRARVLVVDDEAAIRTTIERALRREHDVFGCGSAREALERLLGGEAFDVVFCDLMMPEQTGMDLHAELAARAPHLLSRVVYLTGGAFTPRAQQFLDDVPNLRLEKPFRTAELRAIVDASIAA